MYQPIPRRSFRHHAFPAPSESLQNLFTSDSRCPYFSSFPPQMALADHRRSSGGKVGTRHLQHQFPSKSPCIPCRSSVRLRTLTWNASESVHTIFEHMSSNGIWIQHLCHRGLLPRCSYTSGRVSKTQRAIPRLGPSCPRLEDCLNNTLSKQTVFTNQKMSARKYTVVLVGSQNLHFSGPPYILDVAFTRHHLHGLSRADRLL